MPYLLDDLGNILVDESGNRLTDLVGSNPVNVVVGSPVIGAPVFTTSIASAVVLGSYTIDRGLDALHSLVDKMHVCPSAPADYAGVLSISLGNKSFGAGNTFGSPVAALPSGRQVTSAAVTNGAITGNGTVAYWAAVDSINSRLLASGPVSTSRLVVSGQVFTLAAIVVQLPKV